MTPEIQEIYEKIELYYKRMCCVNTTGGRKYNFELINLMIKENPVMKSYWKIVDDYRYEDRVIKIREFNALPQKQTKVYSKRPCAYIVYLANKDMIKVGKSSRLVTRLKELKNQYGNLALVKQFIFDNEEDAYLMEVLLHKYFKKYYPNNEFIPQDRFKGVNITKKDLETLEKTAQEIREKNWF